MKYLLIIVLLISSVSYAQDSLHYGFPMLEGKINYTTIVEVDSTNKNQLFSKIKEWAVNSYKSQKATLETEDKETGYIVYKGYLPTVFTYTGGLIKGKQYTVDVYHTLKFYIKDDKVKIVFTDLEIVSHDFTSEYIARHNNTSPKRSKLELWGYNLNTYSKKKREKVKELYEREALEMDAQLKLFLLSVQRSIIKKGSAFDF